MTSPEDTPTATPAPAMPLGAAEVAAEVAAQPVTGGASAARSGQVHAPTATTPERPSIHRASPIALPDDPEQAAALVCRYITAGHSAFDRSAAIEAMNARVAKLRDSDGQQAEREMLAHAATLDALFQRYTAEALHAGHPEHKVKFQKLALQCNEHYLRVMVAVEGLRVQRRGAARVVALPESDCDRET